MSISNQRRIESRATGLGCRSLKMFSLSGGYLSPTYNAALSWLTRRFNKFCPHVTTPMTAVYTSPLVSLTVYIARSTNEPSGKLNVPDKDPTETKYLGLPPSQSEMKKPPG